MNGCNPTEGAGMSDETLGALLAQHYRRPIPVSTLDSAITDRIQSTKRHSGRNGLLGRPRLRFAIPLMTTVVAVTAILVTSLVQVSSPRTVSAQVLLTKAASAALPTRGHTTLLEYSVEVRCPQAFHCPKAIVRAWTTNIDGYYLFSGGLSLKVASPVRKESIRGANGFWVVSPLTGGSASGHGSKAMQRWLRQRTRHDWPYAGYQAAASVVQMNPEAIDLRKFATDRPAHAAYPIPTRVQFNGNSVWLVRLRELDLYSRNVRLYIDPRSFLVDGERMASCVRFAPDETDGPSGCLQYTTIRIVLQQTSTMPVCQAPRSAYGWYFRSRGFNVPHRKPPKMPLCRQ